LENNSFLKTLNLYTMRVFLLVFFAACLSQLSAQNTNQPLFLGLSNDENYSFPIVGGGFFNFTATRDSGYMILLLGKEGDDDPTLLSNYLPTLHGINELYGPNGTNQLRIFCWIESPEFEVVNGIVLPSYTGWQQFLGSIPIFLRNQNPPYYGTPGNGYAEPDIKGPSNGRVVVHNPNRKAYSLGSSYPSLSLIQQALALRDTADGQNNATLLSAHFNKMPHCAGEQRYTRLFLSNNGHAPLTSAKIGVAFNGVEQQVVDWTGAGLDTYRYAVIDSVPFTTDGTTADVTFYIKKVNGQPDFEMGNDTLRYNLKGSVPVDAKEATLFWKTANYTYLTYIDVVDDNSGDVLFSVGDPIIAEGGFTTINSDTFSNHTVYNFPIDLSAYGNSCLRLRAYREGGGTFADWLNLVVDGDTVISLKERPAPLWGKEATFHTTFVSAKDVKEDFAVLVYPNPYAAGQLSVDLPERPGDYSFELFDVLGRQVFAEPVQAGHNALEPPPLPPGLYHYTVRSAATGTVVASGQLVQE
jgi:hypothetical protein